MEATKTKERVLKLTVCVRRNPALSEDEFHEHWSKRHSRIAGPWFERHGILKYVQYHTPSSLRSQVSVFGPVLEYDGFVEVWVRSVDDLTRAVQDPEYQEVVEKDESVFIDKSVGFQSTLGWEEVYLEDGKIVGPA